MANWHRGFVLGIRQLRLLLLQHLKAQAAEGAWVSRSRAGPSLLRWADSSPINGHIAGKRSPSPRKQDDANQLPFSKSITCPPVDDRLRRLAGGQLGQTEFSVPALALHVGVVDVGAGPQSCCD